MEFSFFAATLWAFFVIILDITIKEEGLGPLPGFFVIT